MTQDLRCIRPFVRNGLSIKEVVKKIFLRKENSEKRLPENQWTENQCYPVLWRVEFKCKNVGSNCHQSVQRKSGEKCNSICSHLKNKALLWFKPQLKPVVLGILSKLME